MIKFIKINFFFILYFIICTNFKVNAEIKDSIFATVGYKAITQSDLINEVKIILILNNKSYSPEIKEQLRANAIQSIIKRNIKRIEIERINLKDFNQKDLYNELNNLATNINLDLDTFKNVLSSNGIDFTIIVEQIKTELQWNTVIFQLYKDRLTINTEEIDDQLKLIKEKKDIEDYLISEIIIRPTENKKIEDEIEELKKKIQIEGFEQVAMNLSISETSIKGGDLGWLNENVISKKYRSKIINTPIDNISEPIVLPEGILIFKVRDKRKSTENLSLEETKNQLVNSEKQKILNMYSLTHYDNIRRSIAVKYFYE